MRPTVRLPRKDKKTVRAPDQLRSVNFAKCTAAALVRCPDDMANACCCIGNLERPWNSSSSIEGSAFRLAWFANEGDLMAIGRPHRLAIVGSAGIEVSNCL